MNNIKQIDVSGHRYDICDANMRAAVTDEYDVLAAYTVGDFCIYNNVLYRCLEDTTGVWQEEKWEKKTLAEMYKEMKTTVDAELSALNANINNKPPIEDPAFKGSVKSTKVVSPGPDAYAVAQFVSETDGTNPETRCGYGFHNAGTNGGFLYLDFNGFLKFYRSDGSVKVIKFED